jgi:hypothetical protein
MKKRIAGLVALGVIAAFTFGPDGPLGGFWRPLEGAEQPTGLMIPGFLGVALVEGLALGVALVLIVYGRPRFTGVVRSSRLATAAWLSSIFLLGSWWPHAALHRHVGEDLEGLLAIEWVFHVGSVVAAALLIATLTSLTPTGTRYDERLRIEGEQFRPPVQRRELALVRQPGSDTCL